MKNLSFAWLLLVAAVPLPAAGPKSTEDLERSDSLKKRDVPVEYVLFPDEGHGFRKTPNRIRAAVAIVEWFTKYLKPEPNRAAAN
jgi:Prolyl oligopeptidase family